MAKPAKPRLVADRRRAAPEAAPAPRPRAKARASRRPRGLAGWLMWPVRLLVRLGWSLAWRGAVLLLVRRVSDGLAAWLSPAFGPEPLRLEPDADGVEALSSEREALWRRVESASFLSRDEKRMAVGYGPEGDLAPGGEE